MTYMYNGTVSVPHNKLQTFLKTAEALKVKGIVDTGASDDSAVSDTSVSPLVSPGHLSAPPASLLPAQVQELLSIPLLNHQHPAGDLSLLASAATEASAHDPTTAPTGPTTGNKRRKAAPRKLGSYLLNRDIMNGASGSDDDHDKDTEKENNGVIQNNSIKDKDGQLKDGYLLSNTNGKISAMNLTKMEESLDLSVKNGDSPQSSSPPISNNSHLQMLTSSMLPTSTSASPLNLLVSINGSPCKILIFPLTLNAMFSVAECGWVECSRSDGSSPWS